MKNIGFNLIFWLMLPVWTWAHMPEGRYKKEKIIEQTFVVDNNESVYIDNSYGNVNILTWNKQEVQIKVVITVDGNDLDEVEDRLNSIKIELFKNDYEITGISHIEQVKSSWSLISLLFGKSNHTNFKINYEVHMPLDADLRLVNNYGNIYIDRLKGALDLNLDYGKFDIGELLNENNRIKTDYLSQSHIDFIKGGIIKSDYSKISINTAYRLQLNCDYTSIKINEIRSIYFNNDGGSIHIDKVKEVTGRGDYQTRYFGQVDYVDFKGDYGSVTIDGLLPEFDRINLNCDYTTIRIENNLQVPYQLLINQEYGCFKYDKLEIYREINRNGDKKIEAYYQNKNAESYIKITEDYGCIKIYN